MVAAVPGGGKRMVQEVVVPTARGALLIYGVGRRILFFDTYVVSCVCARDCVLRVGKSGPCWRPQVVLIAMRSIAVCC